MFDARSSSAAGACLDRIVDSSKGSYATTFSPNPKARLATAWPIRPKPTSPSRLPLS
jgi:hypothetical protein